MVKRCLALAAAALVCAACTPRETGTTGKPAAAGRSRLRLQAPVVEGLTSVDYSLRFWFLGEAPALEYGRSQWTSTSAGGDLFALLACLGGGSGQNQVRADAVLHFAGAPDLSGTANAVFTCTANEDVAVDLVISVYAGGAVGFDDLDLGAAGVVCKSAISLRGDGYLAVCSQSSCGDSGAVFLFANQCRGLDGSAPRFWTCGDPADWTVLGPVVSSAYTLARDGIFRFGVAALPQRKLARPDPALTDAQGNLLVWGAVAVPAATVVRSGGVVTSTSLAATRAASFAAQLQAPGGAPRLLEIDNGASGAAVIAWTQLGPCATPVAGVSAFPGLWAIDLRLSSPAAATLLLAATPGGTVTRRASCAADVAGLVTCSAPGALP